MPSREKKYLTLHQVRRWALAAALLGGLAAARMVLLRQPAQAEAYFQRIAVAANAAPRSFAEWVSMDAPVPPAAITMLRPNATISRKYTNLKTGQQATLLLVQCGDARDMMGHYPPVCYKAHGYTQVASASRDWQIEGLDIHGTEYTFSSTQPEELSSMIIDDFMILPNGSTCRDMDGVDVIVRDPRRRHLGAAQLQILMDPAMPQQDRDQVFQTLIQANRATIDAILAGDHG